MKENYVGSEKAIIFATRISNKGLVIGIRKEFLQINNKNCK